MKAFQLFFSLLFLSTIVFGQKSQDNLVFHSTLEEKTIDNYLSASTNLTLPLQLISDKSLKEEDLVNHESLLTEWTASLNSKRHKFKSQSQFVEHVFYKVHRKLLKNYKPFTSFHQTLSSGDYDCLSGTSLYATLLTSLSIDFELVETNYHIYLKISDGEGNDVLLESTDPLYGFIEDSKEIEERLKAYDEGNKNIKKVSNQYTYEARMNDKVNLLGLAGLQYYNTAVDHFNKGNIKEAIILFEKAGIFYTSSRFDEFGLVLAQTLVNSDLLEIEKRSYLKRIPVFEDGSVVSAF